VRERPMSIFQKLFFLLIISLGPGACTPSAVPASAGEAGKDIQKFVPLEGHGDRLLFKTSIDLGNRHFSGLFLLKALPDSSTRVVFLSELGLNLLDMSYRQGCFQVHSVKEFLDRKMIIRTLQEDFRALLLDLSELKRYELECKMDEELEAEVLRVRHRQGKSSYWYRDQSRTYRIRNKNGLFRMTDIRIDRDPGLEIAMRHKGMRLQIQMREVDTQD
jgi:hypothetical protein